MLRLTPRAGGCADNDGPASGALSQGMCKGLDYFSLDTYRDDPAAEVGAVKQALTPLFSTNRPPNPYEPRGQGIFLIPGLFWFMSSCKQPGGAGVAGTAGKAVCGESSWCANGTQCDTSPSWLIGKMRALPDPSLGPSRQRPITRQAFLPSFGPSRQRPLMHQG